MRKLKSRIRRLIADSDELWEYRQRHYSFIVRRNKIYAIGVNNLWKSHPTAAKHGYRFSCVHSELAAINNFPFPLETLSNFRLVNIRASRQGQILMSKPCNKCLQMLKEYGFRGIWYSRPHTGGAGQTLDSPADLATSSAARPSQNNRVFPCNVILGGRQQTTIIKSFPDFRLVRLRTA